MNTPSKREIKKRLGYKKFKHLKAQAKRYIIDSYRITTRSDEDGTFAYEIETQDPFYGKWHGWKDSDDTYPTEKAALDAGKKYIDNYEPGDQPSRESDERMSFQEEMAGYQRLK